MLGFLWLLLVATPKFCGMLLYRIGWAGMFGYVVWLASTGHCRMICIIAFFSISPLIYKFICTVTKHSSVNLHYMPCVDASPLERRLMRLYSCRFLCFIFVSCQLLVHLCYESYAEILFCTKTIQNLAEIFRLSTISPIYKFRCTLVMFNQLVSYNRYWLSANY